MKKTLKWIICIISLVIFLVLAMLVATKEDIHIDSFFYGLISPYIGDNITKLAKLLTHLGSAGVVISITILVLILLKNKKYGLFMGLNLIIITIFQYILKYTFTRSRPVDINLIEETGYSFPSGHSLTALAFYGFIIYLVYISKLSKRNKIILILLLSLVILIIGLSRIYLGVHFFTDVIGAFSFSLFYLVIYTHIIKDKII